MAFGVDDCDDIEIDVAQDAITTIADITDRSPPVSYHYKLCATDSMEMLGVAIDDELSTASALHHRFKQAKSIFYEHIAFYRCKRIGLKRKFQRCDCCSDKFSSWCGRIELFEINV